MEQTRLKKILFNKTKHLTIKNNDIIIFFKYRTRQIKTTETGLGPSIILDQNMFNMTLNNCYLLKITNLIVLKDSIDMWYICPGHYP